MKEEGGVVLWGREPIPRKSFLKPIPRKPILKPDPKKSVSV